MIRLISLNNQESKQPIKLAMPISPSIESNSSEYTSALKLGQRRTRIKTVQATKCDYLNKSLKMTQTESF